MTSFKVSPDGLLDATAELSQIQTRIDQTITDLGSQINGYNAANSGAAQIAFDGIAAKWTRVLNDMRVQLNGAASALDQIRENYQRADRQGAMYFDDIAL